MIVTSFYPSIYYVFLCRPTARWFYLGGITLFGALTLMLSLLNRFQTIQWRTTRAVCFSILGLFGVVPWAHVMWTQAYRNAVINRVMKLDVVMGACYLTGAAIYANRVPEKWFPGRFDLFLHSHQIFHVFVVAAAYAHYLGVMELVAWRDASGGCAVEVPTASSSADTLGEGVNDTYDMDGLMCFFQNQIADLWND
jgi:adiponectin receptor